MKKMIQFIAGAKCPKCRAQDTIAINADNDLIYCKYLEDGVSYLDKDTLVYRIADKAYRKKWEIYLNKAIEQERKQAK